MEYSIIRPQFIGPIKLLLIKFSRIWTKIPSENSMENNSIGPMNCGISSYDKKQPKMRFHFSK